MRHLKQVNKITLEDLEIRYKNIRTDYPDIEKCSVVSCNNPRDGTKLSGWDTCCAYHRLLFDFWSSDIVDMKTLLETPRRKRRKMFADWMQKLGKEECDKLVLKMAQEPINWEC